MALLVCTGKHPLPELKKNSLPDIEKYLKGYGLISEKDKIVLLQSIGRTSMNSTVKIQTEQVSIILKKSRPWVESYPTLPAPSNLFKYEHGYYDLVDINNSLEVFSPSIIGYDPNSKVLFQRDVGDTMDSFHIFSGKPLADTFIQSLITYLKKLHAVDVVTWDDKFKLLFPNNYFSKEIFFILPFTPSLNHLFRPEMDLVEEVYKLQMNQKFKDRLNEVSFDYDENQNVFCHGTFHPGNWLNVQGNLKVINFEFCRTGPSEFDLGVLCAYLMFAGQENVIPKVIAEFKPRDNFYRKNLIENYCSIEIIRRMVGYGSLIKTLKPQTRKSLLERATKNLVDGHNIF